MNSFKHNWLTNTAAVSLIIFSVVGSISMLLPYTGQAPAKGSGDVTRQIIAPKQHPMSYTLHGLTEKDAMSFKKDHNSNLFKSVKRVTA